VKVFRRHEIIVKEGENSGEDREMFFVLRGNATSFVGKDRAGDSEKPSENVASRFFQKKKTRPGARALLDEDAPCASGTVCAAAEGDVWTSRGSLGAHFVQGDYFGEQALLVDEPRAASVQATSQKVECLVVDRRAYEQATKSSSGLLTDDNPNASSKKDVYYQRTSATKDVEMMWRRLRFQKELETVPLLATLSLYERSLLAKQYVSGVSFFSEIPFGIKTLLFKEQSRRIQNLCVSQIRHIPWRPDYG
jgi:CRP-like cAMP-binding protein